jgi:hypothetical protein
LPPRKLPEFSWDYPFGFLERYFRHARPDQVVFIIKASEPAAIMVAIGACASLLACPAHAGASYSLPTLSGNALILSDHGNTPILSPPTI